MLRYYVTPHIFYKGKGQELLLSDDDQSSVSLIVDNLWSSDELRASAFMKLQHIIDQHQEENVPPLGAFGKCAETYPVVGVG